MHAAFRLVISRPSPTWQRPDLVIPIYSSVFFRLRFSSPSLTPTRRKRLQNLSITFGRLPSIGQNSHERRCRKLPGIQ